LKESLEEVLEAHSAGSQTDEAVRWTDLKSVQLAQQVFVREYQISRNSAAKPVPAAYRYCVSIPKKKEVLGHRHLRGSCYSTDVQFVYDHDYRHLTTGVLVPHGVYDDYDNVGLLDTVYDLGRKCSEICH